MKKWFSRLVASPPRPADPPQSPPAPVPADSAESLQREANRLRTLGDFAGAKRHYRAVLALDANSFGAWLGIGLAHLDQQQFTEAAEAFEAAASLRPESADPRYFLGLVAQRRGLAADAAQHFRAALALRPDFIQALLAISPWAIATGEYALLESLCRNARPSHPGDANIALLLAVSLSQLGRLEEALEILDQLLSQQPRLVEALINKAEALLVLERYDEARAVCAELQQAAPERADGYRFAAQIAFKCDQWEEAVRDAERALTLDPNSPHARQTLGMAQWQLRDKRALSNIERVLEIEPNFHDARAWLAQIAFYQGDFKRAWANYSVRLDTYPQGSAEQRFWDRLGKARMWSGARVSEPLYLWAEQGFGDALMMLPLIDVARARAGVDVYLSCPSAIARLAEAFVAPTFIITDRALVPEGVLHCPLLELPRVLGVYQPPVARAAYLHAHPASRLKFAARLALLQGYKVGIVWNGSAQYQNNRVRNVPLAHFAALAAVPGVSLISVQKDGGAEARAATFPLVDWTDDIQDFTDTAGLMAGLDLVVSVDSAPAHLAGALGVPVWLLNRFNGEWRWGRDREDTVWYQSMRVFNQRTRGDWTETMSRIARELTQLLAAGTGSQAG